MERLNKRKRNIFLNISFSFIIDKLLSMLYNNYIKNKER